MSSLRMPACIALQWSTRDVTRALTSTSVKSCVKAGRSLEKERVQDDTKALHLFGTDTVVSAMESAQILVFESVEFVWI